MPINFEALRADSLAGDVPDDGAHIARLERSRIVEGRNGTQLVTEWSENGLWWTSWDTLEGGQYLDRTKQLLARLGLTAADLTDEDTLTGALADREGVVWDCRTESRRPGDKWFTTTYIDGRHEGPVPTAPAAVKAQQRELPGTDIPIPAADLAPPPSSRDDDDIPF